jgi:hypothetical protein
LKGKGIPVPPSLSEKISPPNLYCRNFNKISVFCWNKANFKHFIVNLT